MRKIEKAFNKQTLKLVRARRKVKALEDALTFTTNTKRRKVLLDPNYSFALSVEVRRA